MTLTRKQLIDILEVIFDGKLLYKDGDKTYVKYTVDSKDIPKIIELNYGKSKVGTTGG